MQGRASDPMGFAISQRIPNRPIAVEVDRARQREILRWLFVGAILVAAALFDGWQRYGIIDYGYKLSDVQRERAAEEVTARRLRLEIETWRSPARIDALARQLQLAPPGPSDVIVIQRVVPSEQPPSSVVASR
jgi:cell division protein FtsL